MYRKFILFFLCLGMVAGFFALPRNKEWLEERIIPYWYDFQKQKNIIGLEERKIDRYGTSYTYSKMIVALLEKKHAGNNVLVLIPPSSYFTAQGLKYHVPEPAVFYYFTGLKTIWINSSNAKKANWYVHVKDGKIKLDSSTAELADTIKAWSKFPVAL
jgi:hypothetical protein